MSFVPDWKEPFLAQYPRWILWVPVFIALGVGIYFALPTEPALGIASLWFVLSFILLFQPVRHPAWKTSCIILLCVSTGFGAGALRTLTAGTAFLQQETKVVQITGTVEGVEADGGSTRVLLNGVTLSGLGKADTPKRVRVKMSRKYGTPPVGGEISVKGVLMPPPPPVAPESYDFQRHMFF